MKILLCVDGSSHSDRATQHVIATTKDCEDREIFLVNVQPPIDAPEVRSHMTASEIEAMQETRGGDALASARALLDAAGVRYTPVVLLGPIAETLVEFAREHGCEKIVMGTRGLGALGSALLGSVSQDVLRLSHLPVTLVK
ncbi:MAG: universal stress protein [Rhodocyclaceae bacterium]|nr:universal stress protein [Rhodocyclaceae bacterium]